MLSVRAGITEGYIKVDEIQAAKESKEILYCG
jgi:hypothetical protein